MALLSHSGIHVSVVETQPALTRPPRLQSRICVGPGERPCGDWEQQKQRQRHLFSWGSESSGQPADVMLSVGGESRTSKSPRGETGGLAVPFT